jgi:hypothetical protein
MKKIVLYFALLLFSTESMAQSTHYWTESFGTRSMLLSGVVTGSVQDLGAVYYNPARLAQFKAPAFVISGKVYQLDGLKLKNGLGDGLDLEKSDFGSGPSLVSGTFKLGFLKNSHFAFAFLTRARSNSSFNFSVNTFGDYAEVYPGDEYFSGQIKLTNTLKDEWMGLSWAYPLTEKFSIGVTGFYSSLERNAGLRIQRQAYDTLLQRTGISIEKRAYNFKSQSILGKFGASYKGEKMTAGFTLTSPKLEGYPSAGTSYESFLAGISGDSTSLKDTYIINNQSDLKQTHKSPWALAYGMGIKLGPRSLLHTSVEWFSAIPEYTILQSAPFTGQSTHGEYQITVVDKLESVINYGLGLEVYINEHFSLFGSFATDHSAFKGDPERISELGETLNNSVLRADIFHFGFGTDIKTKIADLTIGATYATSRESIERSFDIDDGNDPVTKNIDVIYSRWRFLIGFEFHGADELKKKFEDKLGID